MKKTTKIVIEKRASGQRPSEIAREMGLTTRYVAGLIKDYKKRGMAFPDLTTKESVCEPKRRQIARLAENGKTRHDIACAIGVKYATLCAYLSRNGIPIKDQRIDSAKKLCASNTGRRKYEKGSKIVQRIKALRLDGMQQSEIAEHVGLKVSQVRKVCQQQGLERVTVCANCGRRFETCSGQKVYCSEACTENGTKQSKRERRVPVEKPLKKCPECGAMFRSHRGVYCSIPCKRRVHARMRRVEKANGSGRSRVHYEEIYLRDNGICGICGGKVGRKYEFPHKLCGTLDHIVPVSIGGTNTKENLQLAHFVCNMRKGDSEFVLVAKAG